ncbi:hypothetical protein FF1_034681 [Malus domestica]
MENSSSKIDPESLKTLAQLAKDSLPLRMANIRKCSNRSGREIIVVSMGKSCFNMDAESFKTLLLPPNDSFHPGCDAGDNS